MPTETPKQNANEQASSQDVPSPCILVCTVNPKSGYCVGCQRTLNEIAQWATMSNEQKQAVLDQLDERFDN